MVLPIYVLVTILWWACAKGMAFNFGFGSTLAEQIVQPIYNTLWGGSLMFFATAILNEAIDDYFAG